MGIERFFSSIEENNITNLQNNFTYKLQKKIETNVLLIDFNSIIHITSTVVISDLNFMLYQIINKSFKTNPKFIKLVKDYNFELDINDDLTINDFKNLLSDDEINNIIIEKVEDYVLNILTNFVYPNKLEILYIAIDGVPHKSKMLEQKNRRYMGTIINELKNKIFDKYSDELIKEKNRYLYEINKFKWSKIYISPGTFFMNIMDNLLNDKKFRLKINDIAVNIKEYIYSGTNEFGEGEKKIIDYIKQNNSFSSYSIYSPDSDMTLLGLLLTDKIKNINIIRHNQQQNNYDIIDLNKLSSNMYEYIKKNLKINTNLNKDSIIDDLVFVLTIFGNDFLPKLESFNVKYDFTKIINIYIRLLNEDNMYIINNKNKIKSINQYIFTKLLKLLHYDEGGNLQKMYMSSHYQNYDKLKKIMLANQDNFTQVINIFLTKLRNFNNDIRNNKLDIKFWTKDNDFINKLMKLTKFQVNVENINEPEQFINNYKDYYKKYNKLPEIAITFRKYSKSINNPFHKNNLEKILDYLDPNLRITKYDEEIYKLDNMLDEYTKKLNASSLNIGYTYIDPKSYVWKTEKIEIGVKKYYYDFFGISNPDIDPNNIELKNIVQNYIKGFVWVFNYYYNDFLSNKADFWYYPYTHSPLLKQIYDFMKSSNSLFIDELIKEMHIYKVNVNDFFNNEEHLMYVSPVKSYPDIIPPKYNNFVNNNKYFIDIKTITDEIWNNQTSDEIDCRGVLFLNKCHVTAIHLDTNIMENWEKNKEFISDLRKLN